MPAFLQSFIEAEQERSRRIEQLRKEIREFAKEEAGSSITEQILLFLADEMVEHLSEIDYELRMKFELYITPLIKRNYIYRYTGTFDRIRQAYIRERMYACRIRLDRGNVNGNIKMKYFLFHTTQIL